MPDNFSDEISARICKHMNQDHSDAIVLYAQAFGGIEDAIAAQMQSIDAEGMNLSVTANQTELPVRIQFDHVLADAEDAHHTLVAMLKQVKAKAK
jgi:putative heme iron utilization protein